MKKKLCPECFDTLTSDSPECSFCGWMKEEEREDPKPMFPDEMEGITWEYVKSKYKRYKE